MTLGLFATKISAEVLLIEQEAARRYRELPDVNRYWCMIDLVQSTNYRLSEGPERGYVRGESFFSLVNAAARPYEDVTAFKEIGDAVVLCSPHLRPLFEICTLIVSSARQLGHVAASQRFPFSVRVGIDFGSAKRLIRPNEDYLGTAIDRLSRIMSVRSESSNFLVGDRVASADLAIINEYGSFASLSPPKLLQLPASKAVGDLIIYREVYLDLEKMASFSDYFSPWTKHSDWGAQPDDD